MTGFLLVIHAIISVLLLVVILMQSGRGGGLTEGFASAESMLGAQTNEFMIKATTVIATVFFITCLGLAIFSAQRGKSLMAGSQTPQEQVLGGESQSTDDLQEIPAINIPGTETISVETGAEETRENTVNSVDDTPKLDVIPKAEP